MPRRTPRGVGREDRARFKRRLERHFEAPLERLTLTDNRVTIFSSKKHPDGRLELRIHAGFVDAPPEVLQDVVVCSTARGRGARRRHQESLTRVRAFFDALELPPKPRRSRPETAVGRVVDLQPRFDQLNAKYFGGRVDAAISWSVGRRSRRRRRRSTSVLLGSYVYEERRIRIHPILDSETVPDHVLHSVIHHEMVHALLGLEGCDRPHGPEFQALERRFEELARAEAWLDRHLPRLIRAHERRLRS